MRDRVISTQGLLDKLEAKTVLGRLPASLSGLTSDSRRAKAGEMFVAVPGFREDGRRFIAEAISRGAAVVLTEGDDPLPGSDTARVLVPSAREALAQLADAYFGHPSGPLLLVGITGTNGKTTTAYLVEALLRAAGLKTGVLGTIQYRVGNHAVPAGQTTPEALDLQALLARMVEEGVRGVAMEVSSHALALRRVDGIDFDVAVFTNLTQDHLDFHRSLEAYRQAKARFFTLLAASKKARRCAVINVDDPAAPSMVAGLSLPTVTVGLSPTAQVRPSTFSAGLDGITMDVETPRGRATVRSRLVAEHNVMNLLTAMGVGVALRLDPDAAASALGSVAAVPGRFERVEAGQPFLVVVDYAHTPDALERVLASARKLTGGRLAVVFGCGGDRDRGKRPIMGEIAARGSDRAWITSDNPRSEDPDAIIKEIVRGVSRVWPEPSRYAMIADRGAAIREALVWARPGDTVVIAGKGHETYQIVDSEVFPFDDRAVARQILAERLP
ncbi:MAG: UDP-N-acetylmuramoyl-L-alanyl-D-glutamate--2,6-diaminopimelate ligase [Candidatus Methylomirabilia bacterium]